MGKILPYRFDNISQRHGALNHYSTDGFDSYWGVAALTTGIIGEFSHDQRKCRYVPTLLICAKGVV
jgi:hypothetical protein